VSSFIENLMIFGRVLRGLGLDVSVGRMLDVTEALQHVDLARRDDVYLTCRALLVHQHDDLAVFDAAFDAFWTTGGGPQEPGNTAADDEQSASPRSPREKNQEGRNRPAASGDHAIPTGTPGVLRTWSDVDVIAGKDFAEFTTEEIALAQAALGRLVWSPG
jgi:uncharacterized protein with von Willebrand factor type A (vWA) domain